VDGSGARALDIDISRVLVGAQGKIHLHPDGRRLAIVTGHGSALEVWALENVLQALSTRR